MKTLVISIIAGLLYLNPAFAQTQDTGRPTGPPHGDTGIHGDRTGPAGPQGEIWTPGGQRDMDRNRAQPEMQRGPGDPTSPAPGPEMQRDQQVRPHGSPQQQDSAMDPTRKQNEVEPQEGYERVSPDAVEADDLRNAAVYDGSHERVGRVDQVLVTPQGEIDRLVVDVGGFLGIDQFSAPFDVEDIDIHRDGDDLRVYIPVIEDLRGQPVGREN